MNGPEKPADGPPPGGLSFTPEERLAILRRAYPVTWRAIVRRHVLPAIGPAIRSALCIVLAPVTLMLHAGLRLCGRNGIAHASPAGHGLVWTTNVHAFKRAAHGPSKRS